MRARLLVVSAFAALGALAASGRVAGAAINFSVTASGMSAWVIGGANNPDLTLVRGQTYTFTVDPNLFGHPFWIVTARGAGDVETNQFSPGVTNNGAAPGTVTFTVPASAPSLLFYQCGFHDPMGGKLLISTPAPVPAVGTAALVGLAALLALAGAAIVRRARRSP